MSVNNQYNLDLTLRRLSFALYLYFFLLIFEGALRRWVFPAFSGPLLLVRDPIAIYILFTSWRYRILKMNGFILSVVIISVLSFYTALLFGHGNVYIALYGLRITLLHFPLLFVIESVFKKNDIIRIAKWMILLSIPMLLLTVIQFYSPQSSWINKAIGDSMEGGGFVGAMGYFRPPGTFSFTNGLVLFFTLCSSFIFWGLTNQIRLPKWLIYFSLICLLLSIPFSISRSLLFGVLISVFFYLFSSFKSASSFIRIALATFFVSLFLFLFSSSDFLGTGLEVFKQRFESANESEGGLQGVFFERFLGGFGGALSSSVDYPLWGFGIGIGTNVGSQLSTGKIDFVIAEGEWGRVIGEIGPILGLIFIITRIILSLKIVQKSYKEFRLGNLLPWLMMGNLFLMITQGQWAQATSLGFAVFFGGILLAATNISKEELEEKEVLQTSSL